MVKIVAGEIVADDDPRARHLNPRQGANNQPLPNTWHRAPAGTNSNGAGNQQQPEQPSPLTEINNRLRAFGINDLHLQGYCIEPIFLVLAVLGLVFYGLPGLLIVAVVWFFMTQR